MSPEIMASHNPVRNVTRPLLHFNQLIVAIVILVITIHLLPPFVKEISPPLSVSDGLFTVKTPTGSLCWCVNENNPLICPPLPQLILARESNPNLLDSLWKQQPVVPITVTCNPFRTACSTYPPQPSLFPYDHVFNDSYVCALDYQNDANDRFSDSYLTRSVLLADALRDGLVITHGGTCGVCSTTQDLAVYLSDDLTAVGTQCFEEYLKTYRCDDQDVAAKEEFMLGCWARLTQLTPDCLKIWAFDTIAAGCGECSLLCSTMKSPHFNKPSWPYKLHDCLECDHQHFDLTFTRFTGRTRRRSGLLCEVIRKCDDIFQHASIGYLSVNSCTSNLS